MDQPTELSAYTAEQRDSSVRIARAEQNVLKYLG
jgi:hypothetical protein